VWHAHARIVKKSLVVAGALAGLAVLAPFCGALMRRVFERLPDEAPPKWMFNNISAIRENTERILDLLQREPNRSAPPADTVTAE
jgi:hypothetical protein